MFKQVTQISVCARAHTCVYTDRHLQSNSIIHYSILASDLLHRDRDITMTSSPQAQTPKTHHNHN